jgi:hypothetical protein
MRLLAYLPLLGLSTATEGEFKLDRLVTKARDFHTGNDDEQGCWSVDAAPSAG